MGAIRSKRDGSVVFLPNQLVVGRASSCDLALRVPSVSTSHAMLRWRDPEWILGDLGSKNGTYLNGRRVASGMRNPEVLRMGDEIAFAEREEAWTVIDTRPPRPLLIPDDGSEPIPLSEGELFAWRSKVETHGYFYCEAGVWKLEDAAGNLLDLRPGESLHLGDATFRFHAPGPAPETPMAVDPIAEPTMEKMTLDIRVSPDEEAAAVTAQVDGERLELPARAHLYLLAHLARQRLVNMDRHGQRNDAGWVSVEEACHELAISTPEALAVTVYRCRKDFEQIGIREASKLVDRAKRGFLRIGIPPERLRVDVG